MAPGSTKTAIIEALFFERWDEATKTITNPTVTYDEVRRFWPRGNVYAFFKDIVRNTRRANDIWPVSVLHAGYTVIQSVADGTCFTFVALASGQTGRLFLKAARTRYWGIA